MSAVDVQITLSEVEQARLRHKERLIERGVQQVGEALRDIRDERLYRETHGTFEAYCQARWNITPQHANRQIAAAEVAEVLEPLGSTISERQARELAPLRDDPDRMREVWQQANEATDGKPTAAAIRAARAPKREPTPDAALSLINDVRLYLRALANSPQVAGLSPAAKDHIITALQDAINTLKGTTP